MCVEIRSGGSFENLSFAEPQLSLCLNLRGSEPRVAAKFGRMKPQHNVLRRNPGGDKFISDRPGRAIVLDPHLVSDEVDVYDRTVHPASAVPADVQHFVVISLTIDHCLGVNLSVRGLELGVFCDYPTDDPAIAFYSIHCTTL